MSGLTGARAPILVTGASGFLGSHLGAALRDAGADVAELKGRADCDLRDVQRVRRRIRAVSPRAVVHLAAVPDAAYGGRAAQCSAAQTVAFTRNVVAALDDTPDVLLVHVGSYKQYGDADLPFREDAPTRPRSAYGRAKQVSEDIARAHPGAVCLRFGPVYGPGQHAAGLVPSIVRSLLDAESELVLATTAWDPLYVADAVEAICLCLRTSAARGQIINVSGGASVEPSAIFQLIADGLGRDRTFRPASAGEARAVPCLGDITRARRLLNWQPRTSLISGLRLTIEHMLEPLLPGGTSGLRGTVHGT